MEDTHPFNEPINHQSNQHQEQETGICSESVGRAVTLIPTTCPYLFLKLALAIAATTGMRISEAESLTWQPTLNRIDIQVHSQTGSEAESVHAA
jgi:integrase